MLSPLHVRIAASLSLNSRSYVYNAFGSAWFALDIVDARQQLWGMLCNPAKALYVMQLLYVLVLPCHHEVEIGMSF